MKKALVALFLIFMSVSLFAQTDRSEVRAGNRKFKKGEFSEAEIDYKKALLKDSLSTAAAYNLANTYYRMDNFQEADRYYASCKDSLAKSEYGADNFYNSGNSYLKQRKFAEAVDAFKDALRRNPGDMDAKSNLAYAQKMLENQQNQDQNQQNQNNDQNQDNNQNNDQNQDQNKDNDKNDDNKDNNQDQNKDQNKDNNDNQDNKDNNQDNNQNQNNDQNQNNNQNQNNGGQQPKISQQSAQQMLQAIQDKEKETQDKVNKEKALMLKSKQKEKNW
ncbi:MAG: tetratricopeptide repeat protein [Bacteroidales bacterium]|nr:tetratricopeptide repeat protein [Bacteroidales bacterium]